MSSVIGKFSLESCETHRSIDGAGGTAARIKLRAVQSDSWGKYTPSGAIELFINNPAAAKVFIEAWSRFTEDATPRVAVAAPEFYVRFTPIGDADSGAAEA